MLNLTKEQNILFSLLRNEDIANTASIDWNKVISEALDQTVFLMLKQPKDLPNDIAIKWGKIRYKLLAKNVKGFYAAKEIDEIMRSINQRYVILKGVSSAAYYPDVFKRILGDVDFLVDPRYQNKVIQALEEKGYKRYQKVSNHQLSFQKDGQEFEMHYTIPGMPQDELFRNIVSDYIKDILNEAASINIKGADLYLPLPQYHGLILLLHMEHHMVTSGIGLRHLIDWCYFVDQQRNEKFWETDLLPVLRKIGLMRYAQIMTKTGALYLNTFCPDWCEAVDDQVCDAVMNDILTGGNFGRKNTERSSSGILLVDYKNGETKGSSFGHLWSAAVRQIEIQYPHVKKYPICYIYYIPMFLLKRIFRILNGKRKPLYKSLKYADERKSVYEQLHLFEV